MTIPEIVMNELERITGTDQVRKNPAINLYDEGLLDSFSTIELMVSLGQLFNVTISPASFERSHWETPQKVVADITARLNQY